MFMDMSNKVWGYYGIILAALLFMLVAPFRDVIVYSVFVYYIARPFYNIVRRITRWRMFSALFSLVIVVLPIMAISVYTLNVGAIEVAKYAENMPDDEKSQYVEMITSKINVSSDMSDPWGAVSSFGQDREFMASVMNLYNQSVGYFFSFLGFVFNVFVMFLISFYLLKDGDRLRKSMLENVFCNGGVAVRYFSEVDKALFRVFFGNILNAIITAVLAIGVYSVFNMYAPVHLQLPYPILLGILTGVASLVPMIGVKLVWIPTVVYLAVNSFIAESIFSDAIYLLAFLGAVNIVVDMIPDFALRPFVSAKGVHTGAMMMSYIFGPMVFGISGIFIGPMILVLVSKYVSIVMPALRKYSQGTN